MIENLKGIHETINFKKDTKLKLYINDEYVDYPPHWHSSIEIICPLENVYSAECNKRKYNINTGDIMIIFPGTIHALTAPSEGSRIIFQADCNMLYSIRQLEVAFQLISPAILITPKSQPHIHGHIHNLILEIKDEYIGNSPWSEASIYSKLIEMIVLIGSKYIAEDDNNKYEIHKSRGYNEKMLTICSYISEHCTEDISLDDISKLAGFSKYHFDRVFKQFTGSSFYRYMNQKRISFAEKLLVNPDVSITEVAYQSGFSSVSSFTRMFKIIKLCTPSEFKNLYNTRHEKLLK